MVASQLRQRSRIHDFDIDNYLNPLIPRPRLEYLPRAISHFLGYRPPAQDSTQLNLPVPKSPVLCVWFFSFLGAFVGIAIIESVYRALPLLNGHQVPTIIASFGAAAILEYSAIEAPLSQPRNLIFGHLLSAVVGVGITKLFLLLPPDRFQELRWLAGAMSVGVASALMAMTKTTHPPGGATALIASTTQEITDLGWWLPALILLGSVLMLASALLLNNLYKRFPTHWWTPADLSKEARHNRKGSFTSANEAEKGQCKQDDDDVNNKHEDSGSESDLTITTSRPDDQQAHHSAAPADMPTAPSSWQTTVATEAAQSRTETTTTTQSLHQITVDRDNVFIPEGIVLSEWERQVLERFRGRLRSHQNN